MMRICNKDKCYKIIVILIILLGVAIRIIGINAMPNAVNVDEISSGYEAYGISNYGIDRNGNFLPVFLESWGGGQNALLTYLIIPFIKILGLNILAVRLPMAIISSISVIIIYLILRKISNKKLAIIGLTFFAICPWHIMKSRWGLESNLFPDLILLAIYFLIKGLEDNKKPFYYLAFVIFGISSYAYGTSYLFLPVFIIPLLIWLWKQKKITIEQAFISIGIVAIIALPIILYVIINTFNLQQINLPFMTIPKLEANRFKVVTSIFSNKFLETSYNNIKNSISILAQQYDGLPWNAMQTYGIIYTFSIIFAIIGIFRAFSKEAKEVKYNGIFNIWLIASILMIPVCEPNINRLNIIILPIIYYTILGIDAICNKKYIIYAIVSIYIVSFVSFMVDYINQDNNNQGYTFENGLEEPISYIKNLEEKDIYITNQIKEPYIYVLFYTQYDTNEFVRTVKYDNPSLPFRQVIEFGNYHFEQIEQMENDENIVYMIKKEDKELYKLDDFKVTEFEKYIVVEGTK